MGGILPDGDQVEQTAVVLWDGPKPPRKAVREGAELLELFLRAKSELTASNYQTDLEDFAAFVEAPDVSSAVGGLCRLDAPAAHAAILSYKAYLRRKPVFRRGATEPFRIGYSPSTINRRLAALRSVLKLAKTMGMVVWDLQIPGEKAVKYRDTSGCGPEVYRQLVTTLEGEILEAEGHRLAIKRRDLALVRLMYDSALRRKEPLTIDYPQDLELNHRAGGKRRPRVRMLGKQRGDKEWVFTPVKAAAAIEAWLESRGRHEGPLFTSFHPTHLGKRLGNEAVNGMLGRVAKRAGVDHVTPHQLRHSSITSALDKTNGNVRHVQRFSRHKNIQTVTVYDDNRQAVEADIGELVSEDG